MRISSPIVAVASATASEQKSLGRGRLNEQVLYQIVQHVVDLEQAEGVMIWDKMRSKTLYSLLTVSIDLHTIAVSHLYKDVTTDRPGELVQHRSQTAAHPSIPSKAENLLRIRRLTLEYRFQLFNVGVTQGSERKTVRKVWGGEREDNRRRRSEIMRIYARELRKLYATALDPPDTPCFRLDKLSFGTRFSEFFGCVEELRETDDKRGNKGRRMLIASADRFARAAGVKYMCQQLVYGPLHNENMSSPLSDQPTACGLYVHVQPKWSPDRPVVAWNRPTTWLYDRHQTRLNIPEIESRLDAEQKLIWASLIPSRRVRYMPLFFGYNDYDVDDWMVPKRKRVTKSSPIKLLDLTIFSSPAPASYNGPDWSDEALQEKIADAGNGLVWKDISEAPTCPACGWDVNTGCADLAA